MELLIEIIYIYPLFGLNSCLARITEETKAGSKKVPLK